MTDLIERLRLGDGTSPDHLLLLEAADALEKSVECMCGICKLTQRRPLTDEEVIKLKMDGRDLEFVNMTALHRFARAIESAHGIKETEK
jgi:hypothetical protein